MMVTTFQIQTGQCSGNSARLDWVHIDAIGDGVTIRPPQRFGRGLRVRLRPATAAEPFHRSHHTSEINPSVHS